MVIKLFSCSYQLNIKSIMLINVKMSTIVGILTFISMISFFVLFDLILYVPVNNFSVMLWTGLPGLNQY